jgi:eukaryotic translation initiation factor 2C
MQPSIDFPSNKNSFFPYQDPRPIGAGIELWRGFFQSVRPAIGRMLINVDISTGVMYRSGSLIDLALDFLGRSGSPNVLSPRHGLPDRERRRLQQFISGLKITTPYRARDPNRRRMVDKLTRDSARDHTFEDGEGRTMTILEYFRDKLNILLQYPDLICVEVRITPFLSSRVFSCPVALIPCRHPFRTLRGSTGSVCP